MQGNRHHETHRLACLSIAVYDRLRQRPAVVEADRIRRRGTIPRCCQGAEGAPRIAAPQQAEPKSKGASTNPRFEVLTCDVIVANANRPHRKRTIRGGVVPVGDVHDIIQQSILSGANDQETALTPANSGENEFKRACEDGWQQYAVETIHDSLGRTVERHHLRREAQETGALGKA